MTIVDQTYEFVIGVDTHARTHTYAILNAATGSPVTTPEAFPTTKGGLERAIAWAARRIGGNLNALWVIECIATYGALLARHVTTAGFDVVEAPQAASKAHRGAGKSDLADAARIAKAALAVDVEQLRRPRADQGVRAALRVLLTARDQMTTERTANVNALIALARNTDLGIDARRGLSGGGIVEVSRWRPRNEDVATRVARTEAVRLARRVVALNTDLAANQDAIVRLLKTSPAQALLEKTGVGPITAAIALTAWSHPGRVRNEASFASLAGVSPLEASSGNTSRHRLNRGGDRRLNRALHMAAITRMTYDADTRAYVARRRAEGRTDREIRRCIKRYLARQIYRTLNAAHAPALLDET